MKKIDDAKWRTSFDKNDDPYGRRCVTYAEQWADLIEQRMAAGETLEACANITSHEADTDGITWYMYGAAVNILAGCWVHGEELRRWHNLKVQLGTEGERANESGGTLNPAVLYIGRNEP